MNKISKKIVALATMAAFVLTLVPAAAFAAGPANTEASFYKVVDGNQDATVGEKVATVFEINGEDGTAATDELGGVRVWATKDGSDTPTTLATFYEDNETTPLTEEAAGVYKKANVKTANNTVYYVSFAQPGTYTIHAGVGTSGDVDQLAPLSSKDDAKTITVTSDAKATSMVISKNQSTDQGNLPVEDKVVTLDLSGVAFEINGTDTMNLKGFVYEDQNAKKVINGATVSFESSHPDIVLVKDSDVTDNTGRFDLSFKMKNPVNGNIYVTCGDITYTIKVQGAQTGAADIATTLDDGYVLAGTDDRWDDGIYDYRYFGNAVQFEITDKNGEAITGENLTGEPAFAYVDGTQHENYVSIDGKPKKSDLEAENIWVKWDATVGAYTLYYEGSTADAAKDLIPGEYTVTVALNSKESATATFNVAEYGTTKDLDVSLQAKDTYTNNYYAITDEIALGSDMKVNASYVDENGIKIPATNAEYGADGKAVVKAYTDLKLPNVFQIAENNITNEALIGTLIKVKVYDDTVKKLVEKEVTVVDAYNTYTLAFDPTTGAVNKDNTVEVSVVDEDGDVAKKVDGNLYAYVADQSNADAKVSLGVEEVGGVQDGTGELTIYSDKETTVDIVVAVKSGTAIYANTLEYTVGAADPNADNTVVMTIGSTDYVVNNSIVSGDAAPYIDSAWRTMVPFRVLGETFGAEVNWDQDAQTVTYTYGDTELTMTIGEETYTINGAEKTMDTAPVLSGDRTYVPVRFVAEGLGYTVTPLYDAETGLTASVVFQK